MAKITDVTDKPMHTTALLVVLLQLFARQSAASPLDRLRAKIAVDTVTNLTPV